MHKDIRKSMIVGVVGLGVVGVTSATKPNIIFATDKGNANQTLSTISGQKSSSLILSSSSSAGDDTKSAKSSSTTEAATQYETDVSGAELTSDPTLGPGIYDKRSSTQLLMMGTRTNTSAFINQVAGGAVNGWDKYGVLPSVSIAQAILESSWGSSKLATDAFNLFGIKGSYYGNSKTYPTQEYINGHYVVVQAAFRAYPSWNESIEDHGLFLKQNSRYNKLLNNKDYQQVTSILQKAGYATDPAYASTLNKLIRQYNLTQYDTLAFKNSTHASLDVFNVSGNTIKAAGWHASDKSLNKAYHYLIIMDATKQKEIKRVRVNNSVRNDVASAYPNIYNSKNSGFVMNMATDSSFYGKRIYLISRYSSGATGDGSYTDYRFSSVISVPNPKPSSNENRASLDKLAISGNTLAIDGWHAADKSNGRSYHYLILMDAVTDKEIRRIKVTSSSRPDVAKYYPNIYNASKSGFGLNLVLDSRFAGKQIYVISRYSNATDGNGSYVDYRFKGKTVSFTANQNKINKLYLDNFSKSGSLLGISGWHASDLSVNRPYHLLFLMDAATDKEILRIHVNNTSRVDVGKMFPNVYNSYISGFNTTVSLDKLRGKRIYLISRYSGSKFGDSDYVDSHSVQSITIPK